MQLLNHIGQNDRAMQLEMKNIGELDTLKSMMNAENLMQVVQLVENKANFVSNLNLSKAPKEAQMREKYMTKLNSLIEYINNNAVKILSQQKAQQTV